MSLGDVDVQVSSQLTNLVLVEFTQRLHDLKRHVFRKTANVVMRFDGVSHTAARLNPVGCDRPLHEVFCTALLLLVLKNSNEQLTDDLPFMLGLGHSLKSLEVAVRRFDGDQVDALLFEEGFNLFGLVFSHETGVDVNAVKQVADGLIGDDGSNRGVHAARTCNDGHIVDGRFEGFNALGNEFLSVKHLRHRR